MSQNEPRRKFCYLVVFTGDFGLVVTESICMLTNELQILQQRSVKVWSLALDMFYNLSLEATELGSGVRKVRRSWQRILKTAREIFTVSQVCVSRNFAVRQCVFVFYNTDTLQEITHWIKKYYKEDKQLCCRRGRAMLRICQQFNSTKRRVFYRQLHRLQIYHCVQLNALFCCL